MRTDHKIQKYSLILGVSSCILLGSTVGQMFASIGEKFLVAFQGIMTIICLFMVWKIRKMENRVEKLRKMVHGI